MPEDKGRRCYEKGLCPFHSILEEQAKKALPRWVFVSAFGTLVTLAVLFAGWHVSSLAALDSKFEKQVVESKSIAQQNREILIEVKANQVELIKKFDRMYESHD